MPRPKWGTEVQADEVERYASIARKVSSYVDLEAFLSEVVARLGFSFYALVHYVSDPLAANVANVTNLPDGLVQIWIDRKFAQISPVSEICRNRTAGFSWEQAIAIAGASPATEEIERTYTAFGVGAGYSVPANLPDDLSGAVHFSVRAGEALPTRMLPHAQFLGALAYDAARRIAKAATFPSPAPPDLTARQLDCITFVARGKSDWEIGRLLEISKETVHKHVQVAMKRYDVTTRTQLVVRALYRSRISFDDVLK